jgi:hypothetical protein
MRLAMTSVVVFAISASGVLAQERPPPGADTVLDRRLGGDPPGAERRPAAQNETCLPMSFSVMLRLTSHQKKPRRRPQNRPPNGPAPPESNLGVFCIPNHHLAEEPIT